MALDYCADGSAAANVGKPASFTVKTCEVDKPLAAVATAHVYSVQTAFNVRHTDIVTIEEVPALIGHGATCYNGAKTVSTLVLNTTGAGVSPFVSAGRSLKIS